MFRLLSCERDVGLFVSVWDEKRPVMPGRFAVLVRMNRAMVIACYLPVFPQCALSADESSGGFGLSLIMAKLPEYWSHYPSLRNDIGVAAVRRFADRDSRHPAYPKVSRAQPP